MNLAEEIRGTQVPPDHLGICWLGQAGFLLKAPDGTSMVLDPYLTECGERIRGFKRLSPMLIAPEELAVDYYVTSHLHFDHFDYDAIPIVAQCTKRTLFFGPASCQEKFIELGIQAHRCHRLDRGECYQDEKILIRAVMADHGTMAPDAIGLLVAFAGHRLYFSGDTAFHSELFQEIRIFEPDIAVLSVNGAFGNMNAEEGAAAAELTCARYAVPCHFWTFMEHGGLPGQFCEQLLLKGTCQPLCFRQGEIRTMQCHTNRERKKETA